MGSTRDPTSVAVMLIALRVTSDSSKPLRFLNGNALFPGIIANLSGKENAFQELQIKARQVLGSFIGNETIIFEEEFADPTHLKDGRPATMYVGMVKVSNPDSADVKNWLQAETDLLPNLIRSLGKDSRRISLMRAWQVLTGALQEKSEALSASDLKQIILEQSKNEPIN